MSEKCYPSLNIDQWFVRTSLRTKSEIAKLHYDALPEGGSKMVSVETVDGLNWPLKQFKKIVDNNIDLTINYSKYFKGT